MQREYKISLSQEYYSDVVYLSQYDDDYDVIFHVINKYSAADVGGKSAKFTGTRTDGLGFTFNAVAVGSSVSFHINTSLTACAGTHTAEIIFYSNDGLYFGSANVQVIVEKAAHPDGTIDADEEQLRELAEQVQEIVDTAAAEVKGEAEAWAVGQRDGEDVPSTDPTYENNAKYYAEQAQDIADSIGIDATLSISGKAADAKKTGDEISSLKEDLTAVVPYPESPDSKYGTAGQLLRTKGNGKTEWVDEGLPTDEQTAEAVTAWLNDHPEATTTVQDGSLTYKKLVNGTLGFVTPKMFGAKGDGETDDTVAMQTMFNVAAENGFSVLDNQACDYICGALTIPSGIPFVFLSGTIIDTSTAKNALITLGSAASPVVDAEITINIKIGANTNYGIYGENVTKTKITGCRIESIAQGVRRYSILLKASNNNIISDCEIINTLTPSPEWQFGIVLMSDLTASYGGYFDGNGGGIVMADHPCADNIIKNNKIANGTHGIVINGGIRNKILGNFISYQSHRCVALEPSACDNLIANNHFHAYGSTGVIMGYNAYRNVVCDNKFSDDLSVFSADGEGAITMYVGVRENKITGNYIDSHRRWGIYMAIDAIGNVVSDNVIKNYRLAGIAIESDWIPEGGTITEATIPTDAKFSRRFSPSSMVDSDGNPVSYWAFNDSTGNRIVNNHIYNADTESRAQIYLCQMGNRVKLNRNVIEGNVFANLGSSADYHIYVYENHSPFLIQNDLIANAFIGSTGLSNRFAIGAAYVFPARIGNGWIDDGDITVSGATIDAIIGKMFVCSNSSATNISSISNLQKWREYYIVLDSNTSIIESSRIKLKNGTIAPGDKKVCAFISTDGVILREL